MSVTFKTRWKKHSPTLKVCESKHGSYRLERELFSPRFYRASYKTPDGRWRYLRGRGRGALRCKHRKGVESAVRKLAENGRSDGQLFLL